MPAEGGVRVDTGVYEGGEISMFYDSMIAKLIVHAADRPQAIARMRDALNAFAIRGISSNIAFQSALLGHPQFASGQFNTGFIAEHFPKGFAPSAAAHADPALLVAVAAAMSAAAERGHEPPGGAHRSTVARDCVVVTGEAAARTATPVTVARHGDRWRIGLAGRTIDLALSGELRDRVLHGDADGASFAMQVERQGIHWLVSHEGSQIRARVLSPRAAELDALMPYKPPPDLSRFLLAPMPGLLVDVAVSVGQSVRAGERLAVIEAMKMENILLAAQDAVVAEVPVRKGDSLAVDQVILRFQ
jgi:propionyl-CoA carboxylase alpha chain